VDRGTGLDFKAGCYGSNSQKIINDIQSYHSNSHLWIRSLLSISDPHKTLKGVLKVTSKT